VGSTYFKLYDGEELVLHAILCKNVEGEIGWYELVHGNFHPVDEAFILSLQQAHIDNATQWIDTGVEPTIEVTD
jgi:hypothetical protein